jgi:hypothetical protein
MDNVLTVALVVVLVTVITGIVLFDKLLMLGYWPEVRDYWRRYRERRAARKKGR